MSSKSTALRIDRRRFIESLAAVAVLPAGGIIGCGGPSGGSDDGRAYWVSAQGSEEETFGLVASPDPHRDAARILTGFRGHDVAQNPDRPWEVAMFGRRPSTRSVIADLWAGEIVVTLEATPGRAFQGHGFFTPDGGYLVSSEADTWSGVGTLTIRETDQYAVVGEIETFGIGPHEIQLMPDRRTVVVANGGLLTRPETGRQVLNLDTMDSTLSYVSLETGTLLEQRRVPDSKSSIRHLDVADDGTVAFGVQVQREALDHEELVPLAGIHRLGEEMRLFTDAEEQTWLLNDYVGSVAVNANARVAGFTSPRGNVAAFWHLDSGKHVGIHRLADCSGLACSPDGDHFVVTSSFGEVRTLRARDLAEVPSARRRFEDVRWDNHLIAVVL